MKILKFFSIALLTVTLGTVSARADELELDSDMIIRRLVSRMTHAEAMKACPAGTHLPTIRELAMLSQAAGAEGILEITEVSAAKVPAGYSLIKALNPNGKKDLFYYSNKGYVRPQGDVARYWFWSSSVVLNSADFAYYLGGYGGSLFSGFRVSSNVVRCMPDR